MFFFFFLQQHILYFTHLRNLTEMPSQLNTRYAAKPTTRVAVESRPGSAFPSFGLFVFVRLSVCVRACACVALFLSFVYKSHWNFLSSPPPAWDTSKRLRTAGARRSSCSCTSHRTQTVTQAKSGRAHVRARRRLLFRRQARHGDGEDEFRGAPSCRMTGQTLRPAHVRPQV